MTGIDVAAVVIPPRSRAQGLRRPTTAVAAIVLILLVWELVAGPGPESHI